MADIKLGDNIAQNEGGILTKLWRNVLKDNNLEPALSYFVTRYVTKSNKIDSENVRRKTKSSLINNITASEMTWKTFTNLIFNVLLVKKMSINIKLTMPNGDTTFHNVLIDNNNPGEEKETNEQK